MLRLTWEDQAKTSVVSRWLRDLPSGTGHAESIGVRHANQAPIVLALFILTQVLDGALTCWGVSQFGIGIESNTYLVSLMQAIGTAPALLPPRRWGGVRHRPFSTTSFRVLAVATGWCLASRWCPGSSASALSANVWAPPRGEPLLGLAEAPFASASS
jgi:hypothetical protein